MGSPIDSNLHLEKAHTDMNMGFKSGYKPKTFLL